MDGRWWQISYESVSLFHPVATIEFDNEYYGET